MKYFRWLNLISWVTIEREQSFRVGTLVFQIDALC